MNLAMNQTIERSEKFKTYLMQNHCCIKTSYVSSAMKAKMFKITSLMLLTQLCQVSCGVIRHRENSGLGPKNVWSTFVGDVIQSQTGLKNCFVHFYFDSTLDETVEQTQAILQSLRRFTHG